jgi:hypothetical protein
MGSRSIGKGRSRKSRRRRGRGRRRRERRRGVRRGGIYKKKVNVNVNCCFLYRNKQGTGE